MELDELVAQVLRTWRRHQQILLYLVARIPAQGFAALPAGSKGRDVRQSGHKLPVKVTIDGLWGPWIRGK